MSGYNLLQLSVNGGLDLVHLLGVNCQPQLNAGLDGLVLGSLHSGHLEIMLRLELAYPGVSLLQLRLEDPDGLLELPGDGAH